MVRSAGRGRVPGATWNALSLLEVVLPLAWGHRPEKPLRQEKSYPQIGINFFPGDVGILGQALKRVVAS